MEKTIDKIRKLLELARNNPSQAEAELAAARAAELMARHQIEESMLDAAAEPVDHQGDLDVSEGIGVVSFFEGDRGLPDWKFQLAAVAAKACGARVFNTIRTAPEQPPAELVRSGDEQPKLQAVICLVGRKADCAAARYLYAYFVRETTALADRAWADFLSDPMIRLARDLFEMGLDGGEVELRRMAERKGILVTEQAFRLQFCLGVGAALGLRVQQKREEVAKSDTALVLVRRDKELEEFMAKLNLHSEAVPEESTQGLGFMRGARAGMGMAMGADGASRLAPPPRRIGGRR